MPAAPSAASASTASAFHATRHSASRAARSLARCCNRLLGALSPALQLALALDEERAGRARATPASVVIEQQLGATVIVPSTCWPARPARGSRSSRRFAAVRDPVQIVP